MKILPRQYFGLAGPSPKEKPWVKKTWYILQWIIFVISIWLIIQFYLDINNLINQTVRYTFLWIIWGIFLLEIFIMLVITKHKWYYLLSNWLIILVMIAAFPILWYFAIYFVAIRFFQTLVILLVLLPWAVVSSLLMQNKLWIFLLICLFITVVAGLLLGFVDPGIGGPWQGIWWAFQTVTLVGYGDPVPATVLGQIFSIIIMIIGVLMVAIISASIVALFFNRKARDRQLHKMQAKLDIIASELEKMNKKSGKK